MTPDDQAHGPARDLMVAVALGTASAGELRDVELHLATCAACREELASVREAIGLVGLAAPDAAVPELATVRARLLGRVAGEKGAKPGQSQRVPFMRSESRRSLAPVLLALAAAAILVIGAALLRNAVVGRHALEARLAAERSAAAERIAGLRDSLASAHAMIAALTGPEVRVVNLASSGTRRPSGRMFWDPASGKWTLVAHDLPALRAGRTYQLWIITTAGQKISAGTFAPVGGRAMVEAAYPLPRDALGAIAVTEEPAGGVPQPTGEIVISGV